MRSELIELASIGGLLEEERNKVILCWFIDRSNVSFTSLLSFDPINVVCAFICGSLSDYALFSSYNHVST